MSHSHLSVFNQVRMCKFGAFPPLFFILPSPLTWAIQASPITSVNELSYETVSLVVPARSAHWPQRPCSPATLCIVRPSVSGNPKLTIWLDPDMPRTLAVYLCVCLQRDWGENTHPEIWSHRSMGWWSKRWKKCWSVNENSSLLFLNVCNDYHSCHPKLSEFTFFSLAMWTPISSVLQELLGVHCWTGAAQEASS